MSVWYQTKPREVSLTESAHLMTQQTGVPGIHTWGVGQRVLLCTEGNWAVTALQSCDRTGMEGLDLPQMKTVPAALSRVPW